MLADLLGLSLRALQAVAREETPSKRLGVDTEPMSNPELCA